MQFGFDSGVEFPPHNLNPINFNNQLRFYTKFFGNILQYSDIAQSYLDRQYGAARVFKTVFPSWDNTARTKERALIVLNGLPENYEYWLASTIDIVKQLGKEEELIFINAWNEWAEGCHLEPDQWFGHEFLQATLNAKNGLKRFSRFPHVGLPDLNSLSQRSFLKDIANTVIYHAKVKIGKLKTTVNRQSWLRRSLLPLVKVLRALRILIGESLFLRKLL